MADEKPWEKYGKQAPAEEGPWSKYSAPTEAPVAQAQAAAPEQPPSALRRFGSSFLENVNPVGAVKGIYHAITDPAQPGEAQYSGGPFAPFLPPIAARAIGRISGAEQLGKAGEWYGKAATGQIPHPAEQIGSVLPEALGAGVGQATLGLATGAAAKGLGKTVGAIGKAIPSRAALAEKIVGPLTYENVGETAADVRMGANPERGIVKEGLVGGKKSLVEQSTKRLGDLKTASDTVLQNHPNANQVINAEPLIDSAVDEAVAQAKKVGGPTERLEAIRTALKTEYGKISGTPKEMNELKAAIQDSADQLGAYKNTQPLEASAANALRGAARNIKGAVNQQVPEVVELNQRMQDLQDMRSGVQRKINAARGEDIFGKTAASTTGVTGKIAQRTLGSAPVRTGIARMLSYGQKYKVP